MLSDEMRDIAELLGRSAVSAQVLAGGFSHETSLLTLTDGQVVVRRGGSDPTIEAAVMAAARRHVPVPRVLAVLPAVPAMVLEYVDGTPLSQVLEDSGPGLGAEVGRVAAGISSVTFDHPGFFSDDRLSVTPERPWSRQLPRAAEECMAATPDARLDAETRNAWARLCADHAPALADVDDHARLVHADLNPKNILVTRAAGRWRVDAVLDWEFAYAGCPYADAANMARFGADYPRNFLDGFREAFAERLTPPADWTYLGRVLDMFALSDLVTRPIGNPVADQAAGVIRHWVATEVPDTR